MTSGPSLDELKQQLSQLLSRFNERQILVVLDDLDRLTPFEALEMVSVVKSLADLPNVMYLLSYEEARLTELISVASGTDGHSFLEKIVQYPVHLPAIDIDDLSQLIDGDLETLLPTLSEEETHRLQYAWREVLTSYVSTPRDVRRLVNSFAVAAAALRDYTDPVDLLILDTVRLFEPDLYQYIRRNIVALSEEVSVREDNRGIPGIEEVLEHMKGGHAARRAVAILFPKAEQVLQTAVYSGTRDTYVQRKARRISIADFSPAYFGLDPQKATWGRLELDRILNHSDPEAAFRTVEERLDSAAQVDRSRLRRLFLEELGTTFEIVRVITKEWLKALLNASPLYIIAKDETVSLLYFRDNEDRLRTIVIRSLEKLGSEDRAPIVSSVLPEINDLSVLCAVFRSVAGDRRPGGVSTGRINAASFGDQTDMIREQLLARVRDMASSGELWRQATPRDIILFWWGSTLGDEVRSFASEATRTVGGLQSLLNVPVHPVYSSSGSYETVAPTWSEILDLEALTVGARKVLFEDPSDEHRRVAQRFLTAMQNRERH